MALAPQSKGTLQVVTSGVTDPADHQRIEAASVDAWALVGGRGCTGWTCFDHFAFNQRPPERRLRRDPPWPNP